jgi:phosphatidylserine decarboxylase
VIRSPAFFSAYRAVPHFLVNGVAHAVATRARPAWLVRGAVRAWIRRERIDMDDFQDVPYPTLEDFFLRRLREGARPLGGGVVSPVDGTVVGQGRIREDTILQVKGHPIRVSRLVNGKGHHELPLEAYDGGHWLTIFLRPRGYHYVHAPSDGVVHDARWISGRFFPQNEDALRHVPRIYERNERAVLRLGMDADEAILVMVGASVVGGIHVVGAPRLRRREASPIAREVKKGDELGHFTFGSTVVLLLPRGGAVPCVCEGQDVRMGETVFA